MSESTQGPIGPLRSSMQLTLHTHLALRIWQGRPASEGKAPIMGLVGLVGLMGRIKNEAEKDDPYADFWLIRIEEKLQSCKAELMHIRLEVDLLMSEVPRAICAQENFSIRPVNLPMFIGSQFGFLALYLLITYDDIVRRLKYAHHVALIGRKGMESRIDAASYVFRSLFGLVQQYKFSGVTRADFVADNDRARQAIEAFGELPLDVLEGNDRAEFAPPIVRRRVGLVRGVLGDEEGAGAWNEVASGRASVPVIPESQEG